MAISSLISLRGYISGLLVGSRGIAPTDITNTAGPSSVVQVVLASGTNTILIPSNAYGAIIVFDPTSTTVKTLKGSAGDAGIVLAKNKWNVITFDSTPPANFVIIASGADTGKTTEITFF